MVAHRERDINIAQSCKILWDTDQSEKKRTEKEYVDIKKIKDLILISIQSLNDILVFHLLKDNISNLYRFTDQ